MQGECRVGLVVDHVLMRKGLRALIEMRGCGRVVAEADYPAELPRDVSCDCVIFFCLRRSPQAVELARELAPVPLLVMTGEDDPEGLGRDLEAGVRGFVPVTVGMEDLQKAVLRVCRGERFLDPALAVRTPREPSALSRGDRRDEGCGGSPVPRIPRPPVRGPGRGAEWPE